MRRDKLRLMVPKSEYALAETFPQNAKNRKITITPHFSHG
jgi:hypothetical protein